MYALLCIGFLFSFWGMFIYKVLRNVQRENENKRDNQLNYIQKINQLYDKNKKAKEAD